MLPDVLPALLPAELPELPAGGPPAAWVAELLKDREPMIELPAESVPAVEVW